MAGIRSFPVTVTADASFTPEQQQSLNYVVSQWNAVGQRVLKQDLFLLRFAKLSHSLMRLNPTDCQQDFGGNQDFYVVREKSLEHWKSVGLSKVIPGATFRCEQGPEVLRQIIFLFPEVIHPEQFSSVALHELGHAIGLDHSCLNQSTSRPDYRSCKGLDVTHPYRQAVMYPWLHVSSGKGDLPEIKDSLKSDDRRRASCALSSS